MLRSRKFSMLSFYGAGTTSRTQDLECVYGWGPRPPFPSYSGSKWVV